jgi:spore coat protein U-like protein
MKDRKCTPNTRRAAPLALILVALLQATLAFASCRVNSVSDVHFGSYDVFSTVPNQNGIGSLSIKCTGGSSAIVKLSNGASHSFAPRTLRNGNQVLGYNLYTTAARNIVWGDGTGGTSVMAVGKNHSDHLDVFGSIPEGQDAAVGTYTDNIVVTIDF